MKIRKELWFGFIIMALIIAGTATMLLMAPKVTNGHLGLMMLGLVVVAIMLGFPTAFTLMGMGMIFTWIAYEENISKTLTLMVQSSASAAPERPPVHWRRAQRSGSARPTRRGAAVGACRRDRPHHRPADRPAWRTGREPLGFRAHRRERTRTVPDGGVPRTAGLRPQ